MSNDHRGHKGTLVIIGGSEDKEGDQIILREVAKRAKNGSGNLILVTVATQKPQEVARNYREVFKKLGVASIEVLDIRSREEAQDEKTVELVKNAAVVFFTGGDQLRITSQIGDSPVFQEMARKYKQGGMVVGTSAGAAVMGEAMMIAGDGDKSAGVFDVEMSAGLGLVHRVVVDSHFAERGRIGRLFSAITRNPKNLGLGIDEDTAIFLRGDEFTVRGSGAVYVIDGTGITYSNLSDRHPEGVLRIHDIKVHVLGDGDKFDLENSRPIVSEKEAVGD